MANILNKIKKLFFTGNKSPDRFTGTYQLNSYDRATKTSIDASDLVKIPDFFRCMDIIANDFASIDFHTYKQKGETWTRDDANNLNYLINRQPNSDMNSFEFKKMIVYNLIVWGRVAIYIYRDPIGRIQELIHISPSTIDRKIENQKVFYEICNPAVPDSKTILSDEDVLWMEYSRMDKIQNTNFKSIYTTTLNKIRENDASTLNSFRNDTGMALFLKVPAVINPEQQKQLAEHFKENIQYMKQNGMAAFVFDESISIETGANLQKTPISIEIRQLVVKELAAKFGIPAAFLGVDNANASLTQLTKFYHDRALRPIIINFVKALETQFFKNDLKKQIRYSLLALSGLDLNEKVAFAATAINAGIITMNESREWMGFEPVEQENANKLFVNSALTPIEKINEKRENFFNENTEKNEEGEINDKQN